MASDVVESAENQCDGKTEGCGDKDVSQRPAYYARFDSQIGYLNRDTRCNNVQRCVGDYPPSANVSGKLPYPVDETSWIAGLAQSVQQPGATVS